jgi:membrane-associated HD superfamily phosphohydrolase
MINYYINPQIADLINGITRKFVVPNSLYSEELTEKNKQEARDSVKPESELTLRIRRFSR